MHSPIATTTPPTASGSLPPDTDRGALQVPHLKRCWSRWMAARQGQGLKGAEAEAHRTQIVLAALGVGLEQTMQYVLREAPEFAAFEDWIVRTAGAPHHATLGRFQDLFDGRPWPRRAMH